MAALSSFYLSLLKPTSSAQSSSEKQSGAQPLWKEIEDELCEEPATLLEKIKIARTNEWKEKQQKQYKVPKKVVKEEKEDEDFLGRQLVDKTTCVRQKSQKPGRRKAKEKKKLSEATPKNVFDNDFLTTPNREFLDMNLVFDARPFEQFRQISLRTLYDHQEAAVTFTIWSFLLNHHKNYGGMLFLDDTGLGKTLTIIYVLLECIKLQKHWNDYLERKQDMHELHEVQAWKFPDHLRNTVVDLKRLEDPEVRRELWIKITNATLNGCPLTNSKDFTKPHKPRILIVTDPPLVKETWELEMSRSFGQPDAKFMHGFYYRGMHRLWPKAKLQQMLTDKAWVYISYGLLHNERVQYLEAKNASTENFIFGNTWDIVVFDEAAKMRNWATKKSLKKGLAIQELKYHRAFLSTATPIYNSSSELRSYGALLRHPKMKCELFGKEISPEQEAMMDNFRKKYTIAREAQDYLNLWPTPFPTQFIFVPCGSLQFRCLSFLIKRYKKSDLEKSGKWLALAGYESISNQMGTLGIERMLANCKESRQRQSILKHFPEQELDSNREITIEDAPKFMEVLLLYQQIQMETTERVLLFSESVVVLERFKKFVTYHAQTYPFATLNWDHRPGACLNILKGSEKSEALLRRSQLIANYANQHNRLANFLYDKIVKECSIPLYIGTRNVFNDRVVCPMKPLKVIEMFLLDPEKELIPIQLKQRLDLLKWSLSQTIQYRKYIWNTQKCFWLTLPRYNLKTVSLESIVSNIQVIRSSLPVTKPANISIWQDFYIQFRKWKIHNLPFVIIWYLMDMLLQMELHSMVSKNVFVNFLQGFANSKETLRYGKFVVYLAQVLLLPSHSPDFIRYLQSLDTDIDLFPPEFVQELRSASITSMKVNPFIIQSIFKIPMIESSLSFQAKIEQFILPYVFPHYEEIEQVRSIYEMMDVFKYSCDYSPFPQEFPEKYQHMTLQDGLVLVSEKFGSIGFSVPTATVAIILSTEVTSALPEQSAGRILRIGQLSATKTIRFVSIYTDKQKQKHVGKFTQDQFNFGRYELKKFDIADKIFPKAKKRRSNYKGEFQEDPSALEEFARLRGFKNAKSLIELKAEQRKLEVEEQITHVCKDSDVEDESPPVRRKRKRKEKEVIETKNSNSIRGYGFFPILEP